MILIVFLVATGFILRKSDILDDTAARVLNLFVIYISLPALVLRQVPKMAISSEMLTPLFMPWLLLMATASLVWALGRRLGWDRGTTGALMMVIPLGNTSFFGVPMIQAFFSDPQSVPIALIYDQFGSFLALSTYGAWVLAAFTGEDKPTLGFIAKKVITFPPFLSLLGALCLMGITTPPIFEKILVRLSDTLVPVVMVAVGVQLRFRLPYRDLASLGYGLMLKLVVTPALALTVCLALGLHGLEGQITVFESAMPSMITAGALAISANLAPRLAAAMVGFGIVISFATLPLWHLIITRLL